MLRIAERLEKTVAALRLDGKHTVFGRLEEGTDTVELNFLMQLAHFG